MPMNNPIFLPSLQEIEEIDNQRKKTIESLEISSDGSVKCQQCGVAVPIVGKLDKTTHTSSRIAVLENRIKRVERYQYNKINNSNSNSDAYKQLKQELADLLKREQERETLRKLPLYSSKTSGFNWFCSSCYDQACISAAKNKKNNK